MTCTGRTSRVKPFTGRICSTVLDMHGGETVCLFAVVHRRYILATTTGANWKTSWSCVVLKMSEVENPETDVALGIEQTGEKADESKLEKEKAFVALKRQKRLRKSEMTKIRHHIFDPWQRSLFSRQRTPEKEPLLAGKEKLCIAPKDVVAIEKDIEQLWSLLETTLQVLDELCIVYLEKGEEKNREAAMEEAQSLESEI